MAAFTSNSHFLPSDTLFDLSLGSEPTASENDRFIAAITASGTGTLRISERE